MLSRGLRNQRRVCLFRNCKTTTDDIFSDNDDLLPVEGKDDAYDEVAKEIRELEEGLDKSLKRLEKQVG